MQRKATRQSRAARSGEVAFIATVKQLPCICCGLPGPSIADHIWGSSKKLYNGFERVLVGHYAVLPLCPHCDDVKTRGSRRKFYETFGDPVELWLLMLERNDLTVPENVLGAMMGELASVEA